MSWGDGVPTYSDELRERLDRLGAQRDDTLRQLEEIRTCWRVVREHLDLDNPESWAARLDRAIFK